MVLAFVYVILKFVMPDLCKGKCWVNDKYSSVSVPRFLSRFLKFLKGVGAGDSTGCVLALCGQTTDAERMQLVQFNCTTSPGTVTPTVLGNNSMARSHAVVFLGYQVD